MSSKAVRPISRAAAIKRIPMVAPFERNDAASTRRSGIYMLARILGYFSIALGLFELICTGWLAQHLGLGGYEWLVQAYGVREVLTGVIILVSPDPTIGIWLRVIGDAADGATMMWGGMRDPFRMTGVMIAFVAVAPVIIADIYCAIKLSRRTTV